MINRVEYRFEQKYAEFCYELRDMAVDYNYYIFVSRKCYYYTLAVMSRNSIDIDAVMLRDRDILKEMDFSIFDENSRILLVDDTVHRGRTLLKIIGRLNEKLSAGAVIDIAVFALTPGALPVLFEGEGFLRHKTMHKELFTDSRMASFVMAELQLIHDSCFSYVIDLPVFEEITMEQEKFESLVQEQNLSWTFSDYQVKIGDKRYNNGFFVYDNGFFQSKFKQDLLRLVLKCRYEMKREDGRVRVQCRFTPFAMMRSVRYGDMQRYFNELYQGTGYFDMVQGLDRGKQDNYVTLYRAVVYNLSYCIGNMFKLYAKSMFDIDLYLDKNLPESGVNQVFSESIDRLFSDFTIKAYYGRLANGRFSDYTPLWGFEKWDLQEKPDFGEIEQWFMGWISMKKRDLLIAEEMESENAEDSITMGEVEENLLSRFKFCDEGQFVSCLIHILLKALDTGALSNNLSRKGDSIVRCFRLGESSNLWFEYDLKTFYAAVYAYYNCAGMSDDVYWNGYPVFIKALRGFLEERQYFEHKYISGQSFDYFSEYFYMKGKTLKREIGNKRYILSRNLSEEERYIKDIFDFVYRLNQESGEGTGWR